MRDMPAPRPERPPLDHEQHDPLLIAQLAAGDPLIADQQQLAAHLVAHCAACASLAADLRAVSAAVAWEPLPPRRRDFRIDAERAERLRGSPLRRFLRRLSFPETTALRPAAVGILSIGLLFMVAGAVWPGNDPVPVPPAPAASPAASPAAALQLEMPAEAPAGESAIVSAPGTDAGVPGTDAGVPGTERGAPGLEDNAAAEVEAFSAADVQADDRAAVDTTAADSAQELGAQAPAAVGMASEEPRTDDQAAARDDEVLRAKALAAEPAASAATAEQAEPAASAAIDGLAEPATGTADSELAESAAGAAATVLAEPAAGATEGGAPVAGAMSPTVPPGGAPLAAVTAEGEAAGSTSRPAEATALVESEDGLPIESVLMVVGVVLALAGGLLLLLAWLSRRSTDPLLR